VVEQIRPERVESGNGDFGHDHVELALEEDLYWDFDLEG
jgi:hypothetical protein